MGTHQQVIELNEAGAAQDLVAALRARSYACVRLPQAASEAVGRLLQCGPEFFSAPDKPELSTERYHGYHESPGKQVLFVRLSQDGELHPPRTTTSGMESISDAAATAYRELHTFAAHCLRAVGSGSDVSPEHLTALLDYTSGQPREGLSASFMSLFEYRPGPPPSGGQGIASDRPASSVGFPCAEHVDYSLLTLIPFTEPGLEVLDLKRFEWVCPEESNTTPSGDDSGGRRLAVLMVGESLEMLSSGLLSATTHRVAPRFARPRLSCPLLLYPRDDAWLDPASFRGSVSLHVGQPQQAGRFIARSQMAKESAVYNRYLDPDEAGVTRAHPALRILNS